MYVCIFALMRVYYIACMHAMYTCFIQDITNMMYGQTGSHGHGCQQAFCGKRFPGASAPKRFGHAEPGMLCVHVYAHMYVSLYTYMHDFPALWTC